MTDASRLDGKTGWFWGLIATAAVVAATLVTALIIQATQPGREQRFLSALRNDSTTTGVASLPDEQLLASVRRSCEKIAGGWTNDDAVGAAIRDWEAISASADVSEEQYLANVTAIQRTAEQVCG